MCVLYVQVLDIIYNLTKCFVLTYATMIKLCFLTTI